MVLKKITKFELKEYVEIAYKGDAELLSKYWGENFSFEDAVNETLNSVELTSSEVDMKFFSVYEKEEIIGYICCFQNNLYSFAINIEYRTKELLIEFWNKIKEAVGDSFICLLYPQNDRAIKWLMKCGMVEVENIEQNCTVLIKL